MITTIKNTKTLIEEQTIIVCDYCSKSLQKDIQTARYPQEIPAGSYMLRVTTDEPGTTASDKNKEFCSKACLIEWAIKEKNAGTNGPTNGQDSGKYISG